MHCDHPPLRPRGRGGRSPLHSPLRSPPLRLLVPPTKRIPVAMKTLLMRPLGLIALLRYAISTVIPSPCP